MFTIVCNIYAQSLGEIVLQRGILQKVQLGTTVSFMTAPHYFGDGYIMPIVEISVDGEELLSFEEGYENLLEWLRMGNS